MQRVMFWLKVCSLFIALVAAAVFVIGLALPATIGAPLTSGAIAGLILALLGYMAGVLDRWWRKLNGLPPRPSGIRSAQLPLYACPSCGYRLRGTEGAFCPECGTVRPARIDAERDE